MKVNITARKTTVKDSFRERIEKKLKKFDRFFDDDVSANVIVTNEQDRETVEITINNRGMIFRCEKTTADRADSLDAVCDVLFKQIVKNKSKLVSRVRDKAFDDLAVDEIYEPAAAYEVVKRKKFPVHAMSVDEAILQMKLLGHAFFVFENAESGEINVVYSRHGESYGVIEPIR